VVNKNKVQLQFCFHVGINPQVNGSQAQAHLAGDALPSAPEKKLSRLKRNPQNALKDSARCRLTTAK
jgi:hypothetical protein